MTAASFAAPSAVDGTPPHRHAPAGALPSGGALFPLAGRPPSPPWLACPAATAPNRLSPPADQIDRPGTGPRGKPWRSGGPSVAAAQRMVLRHLHDADAHPIGVRDPHLQQPPRLPLRLPQDPNATLAELLSRRGQLANLQPQRHARC